MPNFDTIAEWVLDNLYLAGGVTGAVLLALLIVLLLLLRGRRTSTRPAIEEMFGPALRPTEEVDLVTPLTADPAPHPAAPQTQADDDHVPVEGEEVDVSTRPSAPPPPAAATSFRPTPGAGDEHVRAVVSGLLEGRGELTGSELRRIDLLRPEKVLLTLDAMEDTLSGRGKETQRARLLKLRQYAELLAPRADTSAPLPGPEAGTEHDGYVGDLVEAGEPADVTGGAVSDYREDDAYPAVRSATPAPTDSASWQEDDSELVGVTPSETAATPWPEGGAPGLALDHELSLLSSEAEEERTSLEPEEERPAQVSGWSREGSADWLPGAIPRPASADTPAAPDPTAESSPEPTAVAPAVPEAAPEPVIGEAVWIEPDDVYESAVEELPVETFDEERERAEDEPWADADQVAPLDAEHRTEAAEVAAGGAAPEEATPDEGDGDTSIEPSLGLLDLRLETAEDVLSLEVDEREDAVAFLKPSELGRLFTSVEDTSLKFAIIDTLAREPDSDSIDALQICLDDPDPHVQLYALEAAERIIGAD